MITSSHTKIISRIALLIAFLVGLFTSLPERAWASEPAEGIKDPAELEAFLGGLFEKQMAENHIAGVTVSVVKDGQLFFQKGYGFANLETQTPVDPDNTLFRIGSVTKLFTWAAVLQLYERGQLDLDADINTYLDFQIPATFPEPITLKHLISHTAGFEDRKYDMAVTSPDQLQPLGKFLAGHIPARVRPVGQLSVYSNYGADLAGYIVERISGMPYAGYIETNILQPLGMVHTTALQPLPGALAASMSESYRFQKNAIQPGFFELLSTQPSGAISSTSADMARFMLACLDGSLFLKDSTKQLIQTSLWPVSPGLSGLTYGFFDYTYNGQRILFHPGDTLQFHSLLMLIPGQQLGIFFSYNTESAGSMWDKSMIAILQHYFPHALTSHSTPSGFQERAERYAGAYHIARSSYTTIEKVNDLLKEWLVIKPSGDEALLFGSGLSPQKLRLVETGPLTLIWPEYGIQLMFQENNQGNITHLVDLHFPVQPYEKVPWIADPLIHWILLAACFVLFLSVILAAIIRFIAHAVRKNRPEDRSIFPRLARLLVLLVSTLNLAALVAFLVIFLDPNGFEFAIAFGQMSTINILLVAWLAAAILTAGLIIFTAIAWRQRYWGLPSRIHYTLVTLSALSFVWFLNYWNLLGFRY